MGVRAAMVLLIAIAAWSALRCYQTHDLRSLASRVALASVCVVVLLRPQPLTQTIVRHPIATALVLLAFAGIGAGLVYLAEVVFPPSNRAAPTSAHSGTLEKDNRGGGADKPDSRFY